jgi:hypothetical protein
MRQTDKIKSEKPKGFIGFINELQLKKIRFSPVQLGFQLKVMLKLKCLFT